MGSACVGKSTYIKDFMETWPMYKMSEKPRYTELVEAKGLKLNEEGNEDSQWEILNIEVDRVMSTPKKSDIIFDRSVLDNLVYTMWLNENGKVSDEFVMKSIKVVKETLVFYDILFFLPITKQSPVPFEPKEHRTTNPQYRSEIDLIFKALVNQYNKNETTYFPFDHDLGSPAVIEIFGNREERIALTKLYLGDDGQVVSEEDNLLMPGDPQLQDFMA